VYRMGVWSVVDWTAAPFSHGNETTSIDQRQPTPPRAELGSYGEFPSIDLVLRHDL
jgi:hypothetical protein